MGNQASKIMDKAKDRSSERKSRHPNRALSVKSTSATSTSERPPLPSKTSFADTTFQTVAPNLKPSRSQKTKKSGVVIDQDDFKEIDRSQRQVSNFQAYFVHTRNTERGAASFHTDQLRQKLWREKLSAPLHIYHCNLHLALCLEKHTKDESLGSLPSRRSYSRHWYRTWRLGLWNGVNFP